MKITPEELAAFLRRNDSFDLHVQLPAITPGIYEYLEARIMFMGKEPVLELEHRENDRIVRVASIPVFVLFEIWPLVRRILDKEAAR